MPIGINFIAAFVGVGGFLLGYDVGIIGGVLAMDSFKDVFQYDDWQKGMIVTAFVIGCCFGGTSSSFLAESLGRRTALQISSAVFVVGGVAQVFCATLPQLYAARVVSGFAVGISSAITPFFNSELAPAHRRGMLVTLNQIFMTGGIMVAFWVNYALRDVKGDFAGWRIAIAGQCVPGVVLFIGCFIVPRSPRWLVQQGRGAEAEAALFVLRGAGNVARELQEIEADVEEERLHKTSRWSDYCSGVTLRRVITGCGLQMFQMLTGINSVMYYAPAIFAACGFNNSEQLLATGGVGIVNWLSTFLALWLMDRVGRKSLLITGALGMAVSMGALATLGLAYAGPATSLAGKGMYCCGLGCAATGAATNGTGCGAPQYGGNPSMMSLNFASSSEHGDHLAQFNASVAGEFEPELLGYTYDNANGVAVITNKTLVTEFAASIHCTSMDKLAYDATKDALTATFGGCGAAKVAQTFTLKHVGAAVAQDVTIKSRGVGYLCIAFIYLFTICFAYSWGPCVWCLCSEIWPTAQRAKGVSICTTTNWTFGIIISQFVPVAQDKLGFGLFYIFAGFCVLMAFFTKSMVPETKGVSIDAISRLQPWSCGRDGRQAQGSLQQHLNFK